MCRNAVEEAIVFVFNGRKEEAMIGEQSRCFVYGLLVEAVEWEIE